MKRTMQFMLCLSVALCFMITMNKNVFAMEEEEKVVIVYADLSNQEVVDKKVEETFRTTKADVVEVRDASSVSENLRSLMEPRASVSNSSQFYYGDLMHCSKGTITCNVVGSKVSNCKSTVYIVGTNVSFINKSFQNNNTKKVKLLWTIQLGTTFPVRKTHSVGLY